MRVLLLTPRDPYGEVGGDTLRARKIIEALKGDHEVLVITFGKYSQTSVNDGVTIKAIAHSGLDRCRGAAIAALRGKSWQLGYYWNVSLLEAALEAERHVDIVLVHLIRLFDYGKHFSKPVIFELTDCISRNHHDIQIFNRPFSLKKLLFRLDSKRLAAQEAECVSRYTSVFIADRDRFSATAGNDWNAHVIPNGVDIPRVPRAKVPHARDVLFVGNLRSEMNFDGLKSFIRVNRSHLSKENIKVRVIGHIPRCRARYMSSEPSIVPHGYVEDMGEVAKECCAGIAPILNGAGQQNKILDYVVHQLPVFATPTAFSAYEMHGMGAYVTHNLEDFPKFYQGLTALDTRAVVDKNLALAKERFNWEGFERSYRTIVSHAN